MGSLSRLGHWEGLSELMTVELRPRGRLGKNAAGRGDSKCKGSDASKSLVCARSSHEATMAEARGYFWECLERLACHE